MQYFKPKLRHATSGAHCFEIVYSALYMIFEKNNININFLKNNLDFNTIQRTGTPQI